MAVVLEISSRSTSTCDGVSFMFEDRAPSQFVTPVLAAEEAGGITGAASIAQGWCCSEFEGPRNPPCPRSGHPRALAPFNASSGAEYTWTMRPSVATAVWTLTLGLAALTAGGSVFGLLGFALSDPGRRPSTWAGWDLLFYGLVVAPPVLTCAVTLFLGARHRLPGTASGSSVPKEGPDVQRTESDPWKNPPS